MKKIYYDYFDTPIYHNQVEKNVEKSGYIKINYKDSDHVGRPNLILYPELKTLSTTNISIYKKIHNIPDINYDGELVIEHASLSDNYKKTLVCIPLKTRRQDEIDAGIEKINKIIAKPFNPDLVSSEITNAQYSDTFGSNNVVTTDIDKIIDFSSKPSLYSSYDILNLNKYLLSGQKFYFYQIGETQVYVLNEPILVSSKFDRFSSDSHPLTEFDRHLAKTMNRKYGRAYLVKVSPIQNIANFGSESLSLTDNKSKNESWNPPETVQPIQKIKEGMDTGSCPNRRSKNVSKSGGIIEGMESNYVECHPIDDSGADTAEFYEIPINGQSIKDAGTADFVKTTSFFIIFLAISAISYVILPPVYRSFIFDLIHINDPVEKVTRLRLTNYAIILWLFLSGLILFCIGSFAIPKNIALYVSGIWIIILTVVFTLTFIANVDLYKLIQYGNGAANPQDLGLMSFLMDNFRFLYKNIGIFGLIYGILSFFILFFGYSAIGGMNTAVLIWGVFVFPLAYIMTIITTKVAKID
jgi:hypothetical protein